MCSNCEYPKKKLWAIGPPYPEWQTLHAAFFMSRMKCQECGQCWVEVPYEPFASFRYAVPWPLSEAVFTAAMNKDEGSTLSRWHEAEVRFLASSADEETLAHIKAHYRRSGGLVDLMPTQQPNTISIET